MLMITAAPTRLAIEAPKHDLTLTPVLAALDQAWAIMRERVPALGAAVLVVQRDGNAWWHYTLNRPWGRPWVGGEQLPEIMISGENLSRGARAIFGTLAHEATHYLQHIEGIKGVDKNGRHNKTFAAGAAYYFGLDITKVVEWHGFSHTEVSDECAENWADVIDIIDRGLCAAAGNPRPAGAPAGLGGLSIFGTGGRTSGRNKNNGKFECGLCGNVIRMSQKVFKTCRPICSQCDSPFMPVD